MKKFKSSILLILVFTFALIGFGCSNSNEQTNSPKDVAVTLLEGYKNFDLTMLDDVLNIDYSIEEEFNKMIEQGILNSTDVYARTTKNMQYKIIDVEEKGDTAVVKAEITNENIGEVVAYAVVKGAKEQANNSSMTDEETKQYIEDCFFESLETFKPDVYTEEIELSLVKVDGKWKVEPLSDEDQNIIMGKIYEGIINMMEEYGIY
ncbi:hypothetical protein [Anaerofustis sp. NSJ-163]|uniref:hypothetical protein n=1 Tax=Anaerofustis sp. NSJ-163 TaxID=2944391 RepID=UPI00209C1E1E|nr:hypothetical protein [Anaerofustis sp. NSJ-163]MCO8192851.1 hypothetical protein [Anaerofustis sp. NSJ-163]